ncbi:MAG: N-acetylglucosamine-6-phosphate deacetylase [Ruminococcaceae bacterium]|nr:N-acetylglucosamine-6-phosphate deacetylase [Oscillospiraceae bacterium]
MKTLLHGACVVFPNHSETTDVLLEHGSIIGIGDRLGCQPDITVDASGCYLTPGFIDMHVHGGGDALFGDCTPEAFRTIMRTHVRHGTTAMLSTLSASSTDTINACLDVYKTVKEASSAEPLPDLLGVHLEGPYFSGAERGAQDSAHLRLPDPEEYLSILERSPYIRKWSAACELPGALDLGRVLARRGIIASIGHSDASFAEVRTALEAGYSCITHFYSGCSSLRREQAWRRAGVVEAGFFFDDIWVEVIADGCHLPESLLKLIYKIKGPENICLITDAIRAAGVPDAEQFYAGGSARDASHFIVEKGVAFVPDRSVFAGSIATTDRLVRTMVQLAGVPLVEAVRMATLVPARRLGVDDRKGSITPGKDADLVLLNQQLEAVDVYIRGMSCRDA